MEVKLIDKIKESFKEYKKAIIVSIACVIIFALISIIIVNVRAELEEQAKQEELNQQENQKVDNNKVKAMEELNDNQKKLIDGYSDDVKECLSILKANIWNDNSDKNYVIFGDNYFIDSKKGSDNKASSEGTPFVVNAYKKETSNEGSNATEIVSLSIETSENDRSILTLKRIKKQGVSGNTTKDYAINCDLFMSSSDYRRVDTADFLNVDGLNDEVLNFINKDEAGLISAIKEYCSLNQPSVTKVSFNGIIYVDLAQKVKVLEFSCNNKSSTQLQIIYSTERKDFSVVEGSGYVNY